MKPELLAPAGDRSKLNTAFYYGADAVYLSGTAFGLRAYAGNFELDEMAQAVKYAHGIDKKVYVAVNIYAFNDDFGGLKEYIRELERIGADAVIVSDPGILSVVKSVSNLSIHLSTQANTTNKYAAKFWADQGVSRIILARELSLKDIKEIRDGISADVELEAFVHGAMCISYSGRCLLSNFLTGRNGNRGECVQACRWNYEVREKSKNGDYLPVEEDGRGTYIFNGKDLNMIEHIDKLVDAGITSFKIEGRMKSEYYVATTVNAYRRAIDLYAAAPSEYKADRTLSEELNKIGHRKYTTGFYLNENNREYTESSKPEQEYDYIADVIDYCDGCAKLVMRNRFKKGDLLEVLSPRDSFNAQIKADNLTDDTGCPIDDAKLVQQRLLLKTDVKLKAGDILRRRNAQNNRR